MLKKLTKFATTLFAVGLIVFSCMSLVAHAEGLPTFTSATYDPTTGAFVITGSNLVQVTGNNNDIQLSKVTITDGLNHSYTLKSKGEITSDKSATINLSTTDMAGLSFLDKKGTAAINGGTYQVLVNAGWNGSTSVTDYSAHALTVGTVDKLSSATYDVTTGKLVLTGDYIASVTGLKNDVSPKYITVSDGASRAYTLTTSGVEKDSDTQATITLSATDQLGLQKIIDANGTQSTSKHDYKLTAAYGWNGTQLAQMAGYAITVSNYAGPTVSIKTSSVTLGSSITTTANAIVMSKPGYLYFVPSTTDLTGKAQSDLDALVTGGTALKGTVTSVKSVTVPTSSKVFKFTVSSADFKAVAVDYAGMLSTLSDNVLTINNVSAPSLTATAAAGSVIDSAKVTATAGDKDSLAYEFSDKTITTPKVATAITLATDQTPVAGSIYAYTSGNDIVGVSATNKYLGIYELDGSKKVVKFKLITLTTSNIKAPALTSAEASDSTLTIACDKLSSSSAPDPKYFTVKDGTVADVVKSVAIAEDGKSITLTLTNAVYAGHTISLAYTKPSTGGLADAAGNYVASVAAGKITVTNSTVAQDAPTITTATIADLTGSGNNGKGVITLSAAGSGNHYVYKVKDTDSLPKLGAILSTGWTTVADKGTVNIASDAATANTKDVFVSEVTSGGVVVKASKITVSGIADYSAATSGKLTGTVAFADDTAVTSVVKSAMAFTVTVDGSAKSVTVADTVDTKVKLLAAINSALGTSATASFDSSNYILITSASTGTSSTVAVSANDVASFFGGSPSAVNGHGIQG